MHTATGYIDGLLNIGHIATYSLSVRVLMVSDALSAAVISAKDKLLQSTPNPPEPLLYKQAHRSKSATSSHSAEAKLSGETATSANSRTAASNSR